VADEDRPVVDARVEDPGGPVEAPPGERLAVGAPDARRERGEEQREDQRGSEARGAAGGQRATGRPAGPARPRARAAGPTDTRNPPR
jgi:hypothetical protein